MAASKERGPYYIGESGRAIVRRNGAGEIVQVTDGDALGAVFWCHQLNSAYDQGAKDARARRAAKGKR